MINKPDLGLIVKAYSKWYKHILDVNAISGLVGGFSEEEIAAYNLRLEETRKRRARKPVNLNLLDKDFFDKSQSVLRRIYNHDDLHRATCYYDRPLYERLKVNSDKALLSKSKFFTLPFKDRIRTAREEAFSIALERFCIPYNTLLVSDGSLELRLAVFLLATRLCTGWFKEFVVDNVLEIEKSDVDYVNKFRLAVGLGRVKLYNE